jgi:hypothetical protein
MEFEQQTPQYQQLSRKSGDVDLRYFPNYRWHEADDPLEQQAMDYVGHLIDLHQCGPHFYANLDSSVLERWLAEDCPELVERLTGQDSYDAFAHNLDAYCRRLSAAGCIADAFLGESLDYNQGEFRHFEWERFFPGLLDQVQCGEIRSRENLPAVVALLVDRFSRIGEARWHDNTGYFPHSRLASTGWDWCDLAQVKAAAQGVAFLLQREHFPSQLTWRTNEKYALVVNPPPGTAAQSLIRKSPVPSVNRLKTSSGHTELCLTLSGQELAIPLIQHEHTLLLFRGFLPVVYLLDGDALIVEYEWNPIASGRRHLAQARAEMDEAWEPSWRAETVLIDNILPMPLAPGPAPAPPKYSGPWEDLIPF